MGKLHILSYLILVAEVRVYTTLLPNKLILTKKPQNKRLFSPAIASMSYVSPPSGPIMDY
jgi:hypothetical protein